MKDSFYTSTDLAEILVGYVDKKRISSVVDFCIGGGELIRAAIKKWKNINCFGSDISQTAIELLEKQHPSWIVDVCDFTCNQSRRHSVIFQKKYDLILLNPPFTCKGSTINRIEYREMTYHTSTSMMFLVQALDYINEKGELFAIMPISTLYSQKDSKIWAELSKDFNIIIHKESEKQYFRDCYPSIVLISLRKGKTNIKANMHKLQLNGHAKLAIELIRGRLSMYEVSKATKGCIPLIHTTTMRNNQLKPSEHFLDYPKSEISGPAVLIPRVGNPSVSKICVIKVKERYILSDCVIGLKTNTNSEADLLVKLLIENWSEFSSLYKGTGAKYVTIDRLQTYFGL